MQPESSQGPAILTPQAIEILRRACENKKTRPAVVRNPRALLASKGIELPADVELWVYERKRVRGGSPKHGGHEVAEPILNWDLARYSEST